jgi:hypothetical protein
MFGVLFVLCLAFGTAQATTLTPYTSTPLSGTTVFAEPQLAGTIIVDEHQAFSYSADAGEVKGDVQIRIIRSSVDDTLDFSWLITNYSTSAGYIDNFYLRDFISPEYNANYRTDGMGDIGPSSAYLNAARYEGYVYFNFDTSLAPNKSSMFFFLDTSAKYYAKTAEFDVRSDGGYSASSAFGTYAPSAVPLPAGIWLLGSGLLGLIGLRRSSKQ